MGAKIIDFALLTSCVYFLLYMLKTGVFVFFFREYFGDNKEGYGSFKKMNELIAFYEDRIHRKK